MKNRKNIVFIVIALLLIIGVGYAFVTENLKINGSSGIKSGSWVIYFDKVANESGVVSTNTEITHNKTQVDFNISLEKPGDYYEFDVDTVNDGTIDAMIDSIEFGDIDDDLKNVITFDVTYKDGTRIKKCDILPKKSRKTITIKVNYKDNIDESQIIETEQSLNLTFTINYLQDGECEADSILSINPNGGDYNNTPEITIVSLEKNTTYVVGRPERAGYIFKGWMLGETLLEENEETNKTTVSIGTSDIEIKAKWERDISNYVARIEEEYYETIQLAIDHAHSGDVIHLLKSTTESPTNYKNVTLDLEEFTVTGTLTNTNSGNITLINGEINSSDVAIVNNGTVTLGIKDGDYQIDNIRIIGITIGLDQNQNFYFYDGFLQGLTGVDGGCNGKEDGYFIFVDSIKIDNIEYQKVYLIDHVDGNFMTVNGMEFYFRSLLYAVDSTDNSHPTVYLISENPESSDEVVVEEGQILTLDMNGHQFRYGAPLTNNGTLTITDSANTKGSFNIGSAIVNNNSLIVSNAVITQTDDSGNIIVNNKDINIISSTLTARNGSAIYNQTSGNIILDNDTYLISNGYAFDNVSVGETTLEGGNVTNLKQEAGTLNLKTITMNSDSNPIIYQTGGTLNIKSGNYTTTGKRLLYKTSGDLVIDDGTFTQNSTQYYSEVLNLNNGTTVINNITFNNPNNNDNDGIDFYLEDLTINGGVFTSDGGVLLQGSSTNLTINDGTFSVENNRVLSSSSPVTINGGTFTSVNSYTVRASSKDFVINGGTFKSTTSNALIADRQRVVVNGGTFISENDTAIYVDYGNYTSGLLTFKGGTAIGKKYGIKLNSGSSLQLGTNEGSYNINNPIVEGELIGIYVSGSEFNFYDGIVKGKTKGFEGVVTSTRKGHLISEGSETKENNDVYITRYLSLQENFVRTNDGEEFNSIEDAVSHVSDTGTLTIFKDADYTENVTIPNNKNITLDIDGHNLNLTKTIVNSGTFTIKDSKNTGKITSVANKLVVNNYHATLNILNGDFEGKTIIESSGTTTITDGTFKGTYIVYNTYGTLTIDNMIATADTIVNAYRGTTTINNGTFTGKALSASSTGTVTINNLTATNENGDVISCTDRNDMVVNINGGTYTSSNSVISNYCKINISDGTITSTNNTAIFNGHVLNITGGTIKSLTSSGINNYCDSNNHPEVTITGGTVIGKTNGIENTGYYYTGLTIGTKDSTIDTTKPVIIGDEYGIYYQNSQATVNFYDGVLKGKTRGYNAIFSDLSLKSIIEESTETIEGEVYKNAYLVNQQNFVKTNDNQEFNSLQDAVDHISSTGTITFTASASSADSVTIPDGKNIIIDFDGYTYNTSKTIENNGVLKLINNNTTLGGIVNQKNTIVTSSNDLTIENGSFVGYNYLINQTAGTLNIKDGYFENSTSTTLCLYKTAGTTIIDGGSFNSTSSYSGNSLRTALYLSGGTTTINNGTFSSNFYSAVEAKDENITINGGTFASNSDIPSEARVSIKGNSIANIYDGNFIGKTYTGLSNYATTTIYGGTFTSDVLDSRNQGAIFNNQYSNKLTIKGGTFEGAKYGIVNSGLADIEGGTIIGGQYGISQSVNTINIGKNDNRIDITTPVISGGTHGLYISSGTVNFYDGILKGKTVGYYGTISGLATDSQIKTGTEEINGETYQTAYLIQQVDVVENSRTHDKYKDVNLAMTEAVANDELVFINNASTYDNITIPDKNLTIDLAGYTLTANKPIINDGVNTITSSNANQKGTIETNGSFILLTNDNDLTINNIELNSYNTENNLLLNNSNKTLTITESELNSTLGKLKNEGTMTIDDSEVNMRYRISNVGATLNSTRTNIYTNSGAIYNYNSNIKVTNGTITNSIEFNGTDDTVVPDSKIKGVTISPASGMTVINNKKGVLNLEDTTINSGDISNTTIMNIDGGVINNRINNEGTMTIDGATMKGYITNTDYISITDSIVDINVISSYYNYSSYNLSVINNSGTLITDGLDITTTENYYNYNMIGILNSGTADITGGTMNINTGVINYGIYNKGTLNVNSGTINVGDATTAYGVYQETGTMIFGHLEGTGENANPSQTSPLIKAVGTTTGIGVKKEDGIFRYFDGKFIGSTSAKPEAPTQIETPDHEVTYGTDGDGYNYCVLTYLQNH